MTTWGALGREHIEEYAGWTAEADGQPPRHYITRISVPHPGDGRQRLHSPMKNPDPEQEPEAGQ
jgi:hypothetical protein